MTDRQRVPPVGNRGVIQPSARTWTRECLRNLMIIERLLNADYPDFPRVLQHLEWVNGHLLNALRVLNRISNKRIND